MWLKKANIVFKSESPEIVWMPSKEYYETPAIQLNHSKILVVMEKLPFGQLWLNAETGATVHYRHTGSPKWQDWRKKVTTCIKPPVLHKTKPLMLDNLLAYADRFESYDEFCAFRNTFIGVIEVCILKTQCRTHERSLQVSEV